MSHLHWWRSNATTCGILNVIKEETAEAQAATPWTAREQAMDSQEAREVSHP